MLVLTNEESLLGFEIFDLSVLDMFEDLILYPTQIKTLFRMDWFDYILKSPLIVMLLIWDKESLSCFLYHIRDGYHFTPWRVG